MKKKKKNGARGVARRALRCVPIAINIADQRAAREGGERIRKLVIFTGKLFPRAAAN